MTTVTVYQHLGTRAQTVAEGLQVGAERHGYNVTMRRPEDYPGAPEADIAAFYGLRDGLLQIMRDYRAAGKVAVQVDMGYWSRTEGGRYDGFHKVSVNSHHPTDYFQKFPKPSDRWDHHELEILPWKKDGDFLLLCGMSEKAAWVVGYRPEEWERNIVVGLAGKSNRDIIYRPKPSWRGSTRIDGTHKDDGQTPLEVALDRTWAVITHHSNVGVDAVVRGIPAFTAAGAASVLFPAPGGQLRRSFPNHAQRQQFLQDLAYCQWKPSEMATGAAWAYLRDEGLIP